MTTLPVTTIRYRFEEAKWINDVAFEVSNVPSKFEMWHYDMVQGALIRTTDRDGHLINGIVNQEAQTNKRNSKDASQLDLFQAFHFDLPIIETNLIELRVDRNVRIYGLDSTTTRRYQISVRNVDFLLKSTGDRRNFPPTSASPSTTSSDDVTIRSPLGHVERLMVEDWDASRAVDGDTDTYWKCEPQPVGDAVVPFYMDVRMADGSAQLIDRLDLDPIFTGPSMNVYFSNDDTQSGEFTVANKRVSLDVVGDADPVPGTGPMFAAAGDALKLTTNAMQLDLTKDWSVGVTWTPNDDSDVATGRRVLWEMDTSTQLIALAYDPTTERFKLQKDGATTLAQVDLTFSAEDTIYVTAWRQQDVGWAIRATISGGASASVDDADTTSDTDYLQQFFVGSNVALSAPAYGLLNDVWVKQEVPPTVAIDAYVSNARAFMMRTGPFDRTRGDYNAVLMGRLINDPVVNVGPSDALYEDKLWTPVYRDFKLRKGILEMPPTFCKYLKLEFTNLAPRPYPLWEGGIERVVRDYPQWVHQWYGEIEQRSREIVAFKEKTTYRAVTSTRDFREGELRKIEITREDGSRTTWSTTSAALASGITGHRAVTYEGGTKLAFDPSQYGRYTAKVLNQPTTTLSNKKKSVSYAPTTSTIVEDIYSLYQRKFFRVVRHQYAVRTVKTTWQQAYFVGLREIRAFRIDYTAINDDPEYVETFEDEASLDTITMALSASTHRVYSTAVDDLAESKTLMSHSLFKTLQIAAISSDFEPVLADTQMHLGTITHLDTLADTTITDVTSLISGDSQGKVYKVVPDSGAPQIYGLKSVAGLINVPDTSQYNHATDDYDTELSYDAAFGADPENLRMAVVARFYLPDTANGTYRLRLYSGMTAVAERTVTGLTARKWIEMEMPYLAEASSVDLQAEIAQVDTGVSEAFMVDFFGIFQNPLHWEVSNDGGTNWVSVRTGINNPNHYITIPEAGNELRVRVTARRPGAWIQKFVVVPHYINSPHRPGVYRQILEQQAQNEANGARDVADRPLFKMWSRAMPPRYSLQSTRLVVV